MLGSVHRASGDGCWSGRGCFGCFGSLVRRFLVFWFFGFLFCLIRTEGFHGVYVGLLGYFFLSGMQGFFLFLFFVGLLDFLFSFLVLGAQGF